MEKIWRVQNCEGRGPYCIEDDNGNMKGNTSLILYHNSFNGHPGPANDPGIDRMPKDGEICGFISCAQAHAWFTEKELSILEEHGFYLKQIEVAKITAIGKFQILAIKEEYALAS